MRVLFWPRQIAEEKREPASITRLNRFVTLKSNLRPSPPLSPAIYISLYTINQRGFNAYSLAITGSRGGRKRRGKGEEKRTREPKRCPSLGTKRGGEDAAHYGRRVEAALRNPTPARRSSSHYPFEMRSPLFCSGGRCRGCGNEAEIVP